MDTLKEILFGAVNIIAMYFLRNKLFDLFSRVIQNLIRPIDFIISFLYGSFSSINKLNYRQQVINFLIVIIAFVLVISEFSTLNEVVAATTIGEAEGINFGIFNISWSLFSAISYITISTLLGFIALELIDFRYLLDGILFNGIVKKYKKNIPIGKLIFAISLFIALITLAFLQGKLALFRFDSLVSDDKDSNIMINKYHNTIQGFYFSLGFLTPIVAAIALISFDIFLAIIAKFLIVILTLLQKMLAAIYYAFEIIITIVSAPIDKLLELFNVYQPENIDEINESIAKNAKKLAPLKNTNSLYLNNIADIFQKYSYGIIRSKKFVFISDYPKFKFLFPNEEFSIKQDTSFNDVTEFINNKIPVTKNLTLKYSFVDINGVLVTIKQNDKLINFTNQTNNFNVDIE